MNKIIDRTIIVLFETLYVASEHAVIVGLIFGLFCFTLGRITKSSHHEQQTKLIVMYPRADVDQIAHSYTYKFDGADYDCTLHGVTHNVTPSEQKSNR